MKQVVVVVSTISEMTDIISLLLLTLVILDSTVI